MFYTLLAARLVLMPMLRGDAFLPVAWEAHTVASRMLAGEEASQ
ncbi:MAG: hypothetical protein AB1486_26415 [Planctomycetota bacterium]